MSDDIFGSNQSTASGSTEQTQDILESLVGEGRKFKNLDDLAKGKLEADRYIAELKADMETLREKAAKAEKLEELLEKMREKEATTASTSYSQSTTSSDATDKASNTPTNVSEQDLERLLERKISEREKAQSASANLRTVEDNLRNVYGDKAAEFVQAKAKELGLTVDRMKTLGAESPSALMSLLGVERPTGGSSGINTQALDKQGASTGERDWNYYKKLMKEDRKAFNSPQIQSQMFQDRARLGSKFGI